jgi:hypothetical protein
MRIEQSPETSCITNTTRIMDFVQRNVGWHYGTGYVVKVNEGVGVTSPISCGRTVGIISSQTQAMEFSLV